MIFAAFGHGETGVMKGWDVLDTRNKRIELTCICPEQFSNANLELSVENVHFGLGVPHNEPLFSDADVSQNCSITCQRSLCEYLAVISQ